MTLSVMEREIREATAVLVRALERGDVRAAVGVYADDAKLLAPASELMQGRAAIEAYWNAGIALGLSTVKFESQLLETVSGSVVEAGRYGVFLDVERSSKVVERGTYLVLHRQVAGGSWQRTLDVFDPDEPEAACHHTQKEEGSNEEGT